jgi:hypothetical protein
MKIDLNHAEPQDDPEGHVGPKTATGSPQVNPEGHVGPKIATGSPQVDPQGHVGPKIAPHSYGDSQGHVGPKIDPSSPLSLNPIPYGTSYSFNLTMTNLNDTAQDWTWRANTVTNSLVVNTNPGTLQAGAQETISATINTATLAQGNSYSRDLTFTFTQVGLSTTITIQFSVS